MLKRYTVLGLLLAGGLLFGTLPSGAQEKKGGDPKEEEAAAKATMIDDLVAAGRMAEFGRQNKVPEALVGAGSMLRKISKTVTSGKLGDITEKPMDESGKEIKDEAKKGPTLEEQSKALFDEARDMADASGDAKLSTSITALIKTAQARDYKAKKDQGERDVFGGPKTIERAINPGQVHEYKIPWITNLPASVGLTSQGSSLHFQIKAGDNELFAVRGNYANYNWTPRGGATRTFTIVIKNVGKQGSVYTLLAN